MKFIEIENWNLMRLIRLIGGIYFCVGGVMKGDIISGVLGGILLIQAVYNLGCCGVNGCNTNINQKGENKITDVEFEEIK